MVSGSLEQAIAWQRLCQLWKLAPANHHLTLAVHCQAMLGHTCIAMDEHACLHTYSSCAFLPNICGYSLHCDLNAPVIQSRYL